MQDTSAHAPYQFTIEKAITEWLAQKETRTGSKRTTRAYQDTMASFRVLLATGGLDLLSNPVDIARLAGMWAGMRTLRRNQPESDLAKPVSASTYNQRLSILSSWYTFARETYQREIPNPIETVKKRQAQAYAEAAIEKIPLETIESGMNAIDRKTRQGLRDYALLTVALATGRRASELVGLRGQDVKIMGAGRRNQEVHITLTFHCKGGKVKTDRLDEEPSAILLEYLHAQYGESLLSLPADAPVWVSYSRRNPGGAISTRTLSDICTTYLQTSKAHSTRHAFSVGIIQAGAPVTELQGRLGHSDVKTTMIYATQVMSDENPYSKQISARFGFKRKGRA
jgi:site-specific recombinase XerD